MNHRLETRLLKRKLERLLIQEAAGDPVPAPTPAAPAAPPEAPAPAMDAATADPSAAPAGDPGASGAPSPDGSMPADPSMAGGAPETGAGGGGGAPGAEGEAPPDDGTGVAAGGGGMDNRFAVSGGGGGGGGGGGMDSGMDDGSSGDAAASGDGTEGGEDEAPPADPVEDAKTQLTALVSEPPSSKNDPLALVKATKGLIQKGFTTKEQVIDLIDQLSQDETPQLKELAERLRLFMTITNNRNATKGTSSPMKPPVTAKPASTKNAPDKDTGLTPLQESTLRELVSETVTRIISENSSYTAMRKLAIQAQETSLDFEKNIVTLLGIVEPDMLDGTARKVYHQAAEAMKQKMVDAVLSAAQQIARLPKKDDGKQQ